MSQPPGPDHRPAGGHPLTPEWPPAAYPAPPAGHAWPGAPYGWPGAPYGSGWVPPSPPQPRSTKSVLLIVGAVLGGVLLVGGPLIGLFAAVTNSLSEMGGLDAAVEATAPTPPGELGDDELLDQLAQRCFDGDLRLCDGLLYAAEPYSGYEDYASTCAGRVESFALVSCLDLE